MSNYSQNHESIKNVNYAELQGVETADARKHNAKLEADMTANLSPEAKAELDAKFAKMDAKVLSNEEKMQAACDAIEANDDSVCAEWKFVEGLNFYNIDVDGEKMIIDMKAQEVLIDGGNSSEVVEIVTSIIFN